MTEKIPDLPYLPKITFSFSDESDYCSDKSFLGGFSSYFRHLFDENNGMEEGHVIKIQYPYTQAVFIEFDKFCHFQEIKKLRTVEEVISLAQIAAYFQVSELVEVVTLVMMKNFFTFPNVISLCNSIDDPKLIDECFTDIAHPYSEFIQSEEFLQLNSRFLQHLLDRYGSKDEPTLFSQVVKWCRLNKTTLPDAQIINFLKQLRFDSIGSIEKIYQYLDGLLPQEKLRKLIDPAKLNRSRFHDFTLGTLCMYFSP
jgi:hypothetical protein